MRDLDSFEKYDKLWNMSNMVDIDKMFSEASSFNKDIDSWNDTWMTPKERDDNGETASEQGLAAEAG
jgi:hypothetical protein